MATEAFAAAADPDRFPELERDEGLTPWQPRKLYYSGAGPGTVATISVNAPLPDGRTPGQIAGAALSQHRSQAFGRMANAPWLLRPRALTLVKSVVPFVDAESDLMRGLPLEPNLALPRPQPAPPDAAFRRPTLEFTPRPALATHKAWAETPWRGASDAPSSRGPLRRPRPRQRPSPARRPRRPARVCHGDRVLDRQ